MERGILYESQSLQYLINNNQNYLIFLWKDIPYKYIFKCGFNIYLTNNNEENSYRDIGCDIMMINKEDDDDIIIVQCKNYESKNICVKDLSGFSFLFLISKIPIKGIIISQTECSQLVQSVFLNNDKIKYQKLEYQEHKEEPIILKHQPRNYQIEAYNKFTGKGILQLPCGMGKTLIACMIASNYDNIIILSPLRNYAVQLLEKFKEYFEDTYNYFLVSMDGERSIDIHNQKNIISSTFCSVSLLLNLKLDNTIIIIDEFHNLSINHVNDVNNDMNKLICSYDKRLFLSATLKIYEQIDDELVNAHNIDEYDLFGNIFYSYSFVDAIKNKYINDFRLIIPNLKEDTNKIDFFYKNMLYFGYKKCIIYCKTIEEIKNYEEGIIKLNKNNYNIQLKTNSITYKTSLKKRDKIINEFKKDYKMNLLFSVHTLDECIDIPKCDSVYITYKVVNPINIIQRVSRCLRIYENKVKSGIFLWCNKYREIKLVCNLLEEFNINISQKISKENLIMSNYLNKIIFNENEIETDIIEQVQDNIIINTENHNDIDLINFIKKELNNEIIINNKLYEFIDDFFNIINYNNFENNLSINIDIICKWLNIRKDTIKKLLKNSYTKNIDYIVERIKKEKGSGSGATTKEKILLTPFCFKKVCQLTKSKKGNEVREYFIKVEKTLFKYKDYIIQGLQEKIKKLENNQKPKVYLIK
jgi:superfamily II DNA or RNA helicase/phage anti-repressor protein